MPFRDKLTSAYPKRLEDEGLTFCVVCGKKTQLHRCAMCGGPLHLTCIAKMQRGEGDIICGPCFALREESTASHLSVEAAYSYEERLVDPEDEDGGRFLDSSKGSSKELALRRSMGYEKPFLLQGLFSRPGERPGWVKALWGETGAAAPSDHPIQLPFKADEGRGPEQLLKDQMDDHSLWELWPVY